MSNTTKPGPQQRLPGNIRAIHFPTSIGGLLVLRCLMTYGGNEIPPAPAAKVTGLPWPDFDMFDDTAVEDPKGEPKGKTVPIVNPVTKDMLSKYRHWPHYKSVKVQSSQTSPGIETIVVDTANWTETYNHFFTNRQTPLQTKDQALAYFKGPGLLDGQDPNLVGVTLVENDYRDIIIPSARFYQIVAEAHWTYHVEGGDPQTSYSSTAVALVMINLGKLFNDQPKVNGKKPATYSFRVYPALLADNSKSSLQWILQGGAYMTSQTPTNKGGPLPGERLDYPVTPDSATTSGGTTTHEYNKPAWTPWPDTAEIVSTNTKDPAKYVEVKVTFGAAKVRPKVEFIDHINSGPPVIG